MKTILATLLAIVTLCSCAGHNETWTTNKKYQLKPGKNYDKTINCLTNTKKPNYR